MGVGVMFSCADRAKELAFPGSLFLDVSSDDTEYVVKQLKSALSEEPKDVIMYVGNRTSLGEEVEQLTFELFDKVNSSGKFALYVGNGSHQLYKRILDYIGEKQQ